MLEALARSNRDLIVDDDGDRSTILASVLSSVLRKPVQSLMTALLVACVGTIVVNATALQRGNHPAPLFAKAIAEAERPRAKAPSSETTPLPPVRLAREEATGSTPVLSEDAVLVLAVQQALTLKGYDVGVPDGIVGPKTTAAIRSYQQKSGLEVDGSVSSALLQALNRRSEIPQKAPATNLDPDVEVADPIAALIEAGPAQEQPAAAKPDPRLRAVQRALADLGYGQIEDTGTLDPKTTAAIRDFEEDRALPVTGRLSPKLVREIERMQGTPLR